MELLDKTVIVTGGGSGIGRALCEAFHQSGARKIIVADIDLQAAEEVAVSIGGAASLCDVGQEEQVRSLIEKTEAEVGSIYLYFSNAGVALGFNPRAEKAAAGPDELWQRAWSYQCDGACLRCAYPYTAHEGTRRRISTQHRVGCRSPCPNRKCDLLDDETRRGWLCREYCNHSQR